MIIENFYFFTDWKSYAIIGTLLVLCGTLINVGIVYVIEAGYIMDDYKWVIDSFKYLRMVTCPLLVLLGMLCFSVLSSPEYFERKLVLFISSFFVVGLCISLLIDQSLVFSRIMSSFKPSGTSSIVAGCFQNSSNPSDVEISVKCPKIAIGVYSAIFTLGSLPIILCVIIWIKTFKPALEAFKIVWTTMDTLANFNRNPKTFKIETVPEPDNDIHFS